MGVALLLGVAPMPLTVGVLASLGLLAWRAPSAGASLPKLLAACALSGFAVAFIEESFLRGARPTAMKLESGTRVAVRLTALLYAVTHFFGKFLIAPEQVILHSVIDLVAGT